MGSAALFHLARRGMKVLGLELFTIAHNQGSSHGVTRIIRLAYYEHPDYVALLRRAYTLWRELEQLSGEKLLHITGSIDAGPEDSLIFQGSLLSCKLHALAHQVLTGTEVNQSFPGYRLPADSMAVFQPDGGFLLPERCITSHIALALHHGAAVHEEEPVEHWEPAEDGVLVRTGRGSYKARRLILSAGAWMGKLAPELSGVAIPERQVLSWIAPRNPALFTPSRFPVFNLLVEEGRFYGFPEFQAPGFKVGKYHHRNEIIDPDDPRREGDAIDEEMLHGFTRRYFPEAAGQTVDMKCCIFTNTPDEHFVIDSHPHLPQVILASPCSGHGFKFASVLGEVLADLAEKGSTPHDISMFRAQRFFPKISS